MSLTGNAESGVLRGKINICDVLTISAYGIAVKHGFKGTEEEWLRSLEANPETIQRYVNEYMDANPVAVDTTLSVSGRAADAKATGDAVKALQKENEGVVNTHVNNKKNPHGVTAEQVGARPNNWMPTAEDVKARPDTWMPTASDVGARPDTWMPDATDVNALPISGGTMTGSINMNGKKLSGIAAPVNDSDAVNWGSVKELGKVSSVNVTLTAAGWSNNSQTVSVGGLTEDTAVVVSSDPSNHAAYAETGVYCYAQGDGTLSFRCEDVPTISLSVNVVLLGVSGASVAFPAAEGGSF